ncbi:MAG: Gfo/Idh/MocA family oxidoreductase [candidate division WS1 bacterium]|jgi:myo-inositol 2-dehydrogenase/D-chiro-inositol 1-dehydrogenase|nr:Gfo/Idh/MocA family oxidoreductase [candidate division WS1 bacterium]
MDELLIGLIGAGNMGKSLAGGVKAADNARIAAIADPAEGAAEAAAAEIGEGEEIDAYLSAREMLARDDITAVIVAAPNYLHAEMTQLAAEAGKHVFCEKPMALTVADARAMIEACDSAGVKLMIGQVQRYNAPYIWMLDLIRTGKLGEPFGMQVTRIGGGWAGRYGQSWRMEKEKCGGPLFEVNAHEIDLMRQVLGEATTVYASMDNYVTPEVDYEDFVQLIINFQDGGRGSLLAGHSAKLGSYDGKIFLTGGTIFFDNKTSEVTWHVEGEETQKISYAEAGEGYERGLNREIREFVEAVLDDTLPPIPGIEGLRNTEIAQAAGISSASNRAVVLPL